MTETHQIKFVHASVVSAATAHIFAPKLMELNFAHIDFYIARYNPKMIIFKYDSDITKNQVLSSPVLPDILLNYHFSIHKPTPSATIEKSLRTIIVLNLNPSYFFCHTTDEGTETLDNKKTQLVQDIKARISTRNMKISDFHFIQKDENTPLRTLKLTFSTKEEATKFNDENTTTSLGVLLARSKKFDQHVPIRQCGVCRKTDHRRGDPTKCDKKDRCPRCLSQQHLALSRTVLPDVGTMT